MSRPISLGNRSARILPAPSHQTNNWLQRESASTHPRRQGGKIRAIACDRVLLNRRSLWPGEDSRSSPGPELLGASTSRGPSRESYTPSGNASGAPSKTSSPATTAQAQLSAEGMCAAIPAAACTPAVLRRGMPESREGVVGVEGPTELPCDGDGQAEAESPEPTLPRTAEKPKTARERRGLETREGHH